MRCSLFWVISAFTIWGLQPAGAAPAATATAWQRLTRTDVEAAYRLLKDNHPAALRAVGDRIFTSALQRGHRVALERAATVTDFPGYVATLKAFADGMGDGHIASQPLYSPLLLKWPGLVAARRGKAWVVAKEDPAIVGTNLVGARIVACAGKPIGQWAREVLSFHTVASVAAQEAINGRWLLLDDGNPFVRWPRHCTFAMHGARKTVPLHWKRVLAATLKDKYTVPTYGKAGFGLSRWRRGYWIAIQSLSYKAGAVVAAAKKHQAELRRAPYVVIDLRGNGGGDDSYGRHLADILYGKARVDAVLGATESEGGCDESWRASPGNIAADEKMAKRFAREGETSGAAGYRHAIKQMKAAMAAGRALTGPLTCTDAPPPADKLAKSAMTGQVIVLTDARCFSSCINTVGFFRMLGALQAGMVTSADTRYAENRYITLPSGLSLFATQQAIEPDAPMQVGPYVPERKYTFGGDIADTAAVKTWIATTVLPGAATHSQTGNSGRSRLAGFPRRRR